MSDTNNFVIKDGLLSSYLGKEQRVLIPNGVTHIGKRVFRFNKDISSVVLPDSLQIIEEDAFNGCTNLNSVSIPNSVTKIGKDAFRKCQSLEEIEIPSGVRKIEDRAFFGCTELKQVVLHDGLEEIETEAFQGCTNLSTIKLPNTVSKIWFSAFYKCESLTAIDFPDSLTYIGCFAFSNCSRLTSICIPAGVNAIMESAFANCLSIETITIQCRAKEVDKDVFQNCPNIKELNLCNSEFVIKPDFFGKILPEGVLLLIGSLFSRMSDGALKQYVLEPDIWKNLAIEKKLEIFLTKQGKTLFPAYAQCIDQQEAEYIGQHICSLLSGKASTKECNMVANFLILFANSIPRALTQNIYACLTNQKNAAKALQTINASVEVTNIING